MEFAKIVMKYITQPKVAAKVAITLGGLVGIDLYITDIDDYIKEGCQAIPVEKLDFTSISFNGTKLSDEESQTVNYDIEKYKDLINKHSTKEVKLYLGILGDTSAAAVPNRIILDVSHIFSQEICEERGMNSKMEMNNGIVLHELGHIELNHHNQIFVRHSIITSLAAYSLLRGNFKALALVTAGTLLHSQYIEYQADIFAKKRGYAEELSGYFKHEIENNIRIKRETGTMLISKNGNVFIDLFHPPLTTRVRYIER